MGGATVFIDIDSVGVGVDDIALELGKAVKKSSRCGGSGAVGAIHQDAHTGKIVLYGGDQVVNIVFTSLLVQVS